MHFPEHMSQSLMDVSPEPLARLPSGKTHTDLTESVCSTEGPPDFFCFRAVCLCKCASRPSGAPLVARRAVDVMTSGLARRGRCVGGRGVTL